MSTKTETPSMIGYRPVRFGRTASVAHPATLASLVARLGRLRPDSVRLWGTLTAPEMLAHLGDAGDFVLRRRTPPGPPPELRARPLYKLVALYLIDWPKGVVTRPGFDPRQQGSRATDFELDRERVVAGLRDLAAANRDQVAPAHGRFGSMSLGDWHRFGYRHVDHHLRQFGV